MVLKVNAATVRPLPGSGPMMLFNSIHPSRLARSDATALPRFDVERLESRTHLTATTASPSSVEPIDGVGNNLANPTWGSAITDLIRLAQAAYADGISAPALANDPSARAISNLVNNQADPSN